MILKFFMNDGGEDSPLPDQEMLNRLRVMRDRATAERSSNNVLSLSDIGITFERWGDDRPVDYDHALMDTLLLLRDVRGDLFNRTHPGRTRLYILLEYYESRL